MEVIPHGRNFPLARNPLQQILPTLFGKAVQDKSAGKLEQKQPLNLPKEGENDNLLCTAVRRKGNLYLQE